MRRILLILAVALMAAVAISAQSLVDNQYYKQSLDLKAQAQAAFDKGDYDGAAQLAQQSVDAAKKSDQYVAMMVAKAEADRAMAKAKDRLTWADSNNVRAGFPDQYQKATTEMDAANSAYGTEDYTGARDHALAVVDALAAVSAKLPLPASYTVRLIPSRRDCLWRIAEYPFVYNNPLKWTVLYDANKKTFRDPGNPNLIFPGQVLRIPSIAGESREGSYDPSKEYESFNPQ
ncbi:MAG TPA: hypothetical protein VMC79_13335 [Rectinemataceae bacterium]|nr:hypothetical protein [Rectinemataceae bacterium]